MGDTLHLEVTMAIVRHRYGMRLPATLFLSTATSIVCLLLHGRRMVGVLPQPALTPVCKHGMPSAVGMSSSIEVILARYIQWHGRLMGDILLQQGRIRRYRYGMLCRAIRALF